MKTKLQIDKGIQRLLKERDDRRPTLRARLLEEKISELNGKLEIAKAAVLAFAEDARKTVDITLDWEHLDGISIILSGKTYTRMIAAFKQLED